MWDTPTVNMLATVHNTHLSQFRSPILDPPVLAIDALSQDRGSRCTCFQRSPCLISHSDTEVHSGGRSNSNSPQEAVITVVPTATTSVCGQPLQHFVPSGRPLTRGVSQAASHIICKLRGSHAALPSKRGL